MTRYPNVHSPDFQYMLTLAPHTINKKEMVCSVTKGSYSLPSPTNNAFNEPDFPQKDQMTNTDSHHYTYQQCNSPQSDTPESTTMDHHFIMENTTKIYHEMLTL